MEWVGAGVQVGAVEGVDARVQWVQWKRRVQACSRRG